MKKVLLYLTPTVIILFNSCTKNGGADAGNQPDTSLKVKTLTEDVIYRYGIENLHRVYILEYNAQNRLIKMKSDSSNIDFEYTNNIIRKNSYTLYTNGYIKERITCYFNNVSGLLDSSETVSEGIVDSAIVRSAYFYNAENMREQEIITTINYTHGTRTIDTAFYKYDNNGNLFTLTWPDKPYWWEEKNIYYNSANFYNSADMIYPDRIKNKNLLKEYTLSTYTAGTERFSYKFDSHHRISVITDSAIYNHFPPYVATRSFTYY
jgi:hypothetical protein